jgi:hypothetical protein
VSETITGKCLCGAVRFSMRGRAELSVCHCTMCRRWSGGPVMAVHSTGPVTIGDEGAVAWYRSSEWAERGFCRTCGSTLFYRLTGSGEIVASAGAFDDPSRFKGFRRHIFIDEKPGYYDFADDAPRLTAAQTMALFKGIEETAS